MWFAERTAVLFPYVINGLLLYKLNLSGFEISGMLTWFVITTLLGFKEQSAQIYSKTYMFVYILFV